MTPITNLAPLPLTRAIEKELEPLPMERVDNTARTGDETYSPSQQRSARGAEDDGPEGNSPEETVPEEEFQNLAADDDAQPSADPAAEPSTGRISFMA
jgi:hypothetical protein